LALAGLETLHTLQGDVGHGLARFGMRPSSGDGRCSPTLARFGLTQPI